MDIPGDNQENNKPLLTSIRDTYTLSNTKTEDIIGAEKAMIDNFLQTLAEIALAAASRKKNFSQVREKIQ